MISVSYTHLDVYKRQGIDLKNLGAGTHNVTVALSLPDGITVVGNVTVNVTITAIQQETTTERCV